MDGVDLAATKRFPKDIDKQAEFMNQQNEFCVTNIMKKYKLPRSDWYKIEARAAREHWPIPPAE